MNVKEEQDLSEVEEKYQCQKAHDVIAGETSVSCSKTEKRCSQRNIQRKKVKRPFSCSQCGNAFTRKKYLNNHMSIHNRIKTFTCSECGNTFKQKRRLDEHMTIVPNGKRAFTCSGCGNTFTCKESLKNHMKIHALLEGHSKRESKKPGRPSVEGGEMPQRLTERHWLRVADDRPDCVVCSDRARSKGLMPNIFLIYSRSLSLSPFKQQTFEILMSKSSIFSKKPWRLKG
uniref:C2H2-type domain-containing protein n=1 Tax=Sinocyclocheilus grahami TaxID=75366 RepID=A0A672MGK1_SINGR